MIQKKIQSARQLKKTLARQRKGKKVVFTNGCFDLLHAGHVTYLDRARKLGQILVVALNSDSSVTQLKGPGRPVNGLKDRATVMAALESVSYVTWFSEDTPLKLIQFLMPDILVKGGDYVAKDIVGYADVKKNGGAVKVLKFLKGRSTSRMIEKMKTKG